MDELKSYFQDKRNLINLIILVIIIIAIPASVYLVRQQQTIRSKAAVDAVQVLDGPNVIQGNPPKILLDEEGRAIVPLRLTSPFGPPR